MALPTKFSAICPFMNDVYACLTFADMLKYYTTIEGRGIHNTRNRMARGINYWLTLRASMTLLANVIGSADSYTTIVSDKLFPCNKTGIRLKPGRSIMTPK